MHSCQTEVAEPKRYENCQTEALLKNLTQWEIQNPFDDCQVQLQTPFPHFAHHKSGKRPQSPSTQRLPATTQDSQVWSQKNPNRNQIQTEKILLKTYTKKKKIAKPGVPPKKESSCKTSFPQCKLAILCFFEKRKVFKSHRPQDSALNIYTHTYLYFHFSRAYT